MGKIPESAVYFEVYKKKMAKEMDDEYTVSSVSVKAGPLSVCVGVPLPLLCFYQLLSKMEKGENEQPVWTHESL